MAAQNELSGILSINVGPFLDGINNAIAQGAQKVTAFINGAGKVALRVETADAVGGLKTVETELGKLDAELKKPHKVDVDTAPAEKKASGLKSLFTDALSFAGGNLLAGGIQGALSGVGDFLTKSFESVARIERLNTQTEQVIKSTGGAAGVTAEHVEELTGNLENLTATEAESIQQGANMLLTFTNVKNGVGANNQIFDRATTTITDMARALDKTGAAEIDTSGAALQLGKALNDPTKGIAALSRVGVAFTAQQKEQIKTMQQSGDIAGAQTIILDELQKEFGGSAEAFGKTTKGQIELAKHALGTFGEALVGGLAPLIAGVSSVAADGLNALAVVADEVTAVLGGVFSFVGEHSTEFGLLAGAIVAIGVASQAAAIQAAALAAAESASAAITAGRSAIMGLFTASVTSNATATAANAAAQQAYVAALAEGATAEEAAAAASAAHAASIEATNALEVEQATAAQLVVATKAAEVAAQQAYDAALLEGLSIQEASAISAQVYSTTLAEETSATITATGASSALNASLLANPIVLVIAGVAALIAALVIAYKNVDEFREVVDRAWAKIKEFAQTIITAVTPVIEALWGVLKQVAMFILEVVVANFQILWAIVKTVASVFYDIASAVFKFLGHLLGLDKATKSTGESTSFLQKALNFLASAFGSVQSAIEVLRAGLAGLIGAFNAIGTTISTFFDLLTHGNIIGAVKAFAGIGDAVADGFTEAYLNKLKEIRTPTVPAPVVEEGAPAGAAADAVAEAGKTEKGTVLKLTSDLKSIRDDARKRETDAALAAIDDQATQERAKLKAKYDAERDQAKAAQKAVLDKLRENAKAEKPATLELEVTDSTGKVLKTLTTEREIKEQFERDTAARLLAIETQRAAEAANLEEKIAKDKADAEKKAADEALKKEQDAAKARIQSLKDQQSVIASDTAKGLAERLALQKKINAEERALLTTDDARAAFDKTAFKATADAEKAIRHQAKLEEIAELTTLEEQQRALDLLALEEKLDADLEANKLNEAKKIELLKDAARAREKIEEDFLLKTDGMYRLSVQFRSALVSALTDAFKSGGSEQLDAERKKVDEERQILREDHAAKRIDDRQAREQEAALDKRQRALDEKQGVADVKFLETLRQRAVTFGAALQARATEELAAKATAAQQKIADGDRVTLKEKQALFASAGTAIVGSLVEVTAAGKLLTKEGSDAVLASAATTLKALLNVYAAEIFGSALAFLGPIAGPIAAALAMGVLGLLEDAAIRGLGIKAARTGERYVPGNPADGDSVLRLVQPQEGILTVEENRFWRPFIDAGPDVLRMLALPMPSVQAMLGLVAPAEQMASAALDHTMVLAETLSDLPDQIETLSLQFSQVHTRLVGIEEHTAGIRRTNKQMADAPVAGGFGR